MKQNNKIAIKLGGSVDLSQITPEIAKIANRATIIVVGKPDLAEIMAGYGSSVLIAEKLPENLIPGTVYFVPEVGNSDIPTVRVANDVDVNYSDTPVLPEWTWKKMGVGYICKPGSIEEAIDSMMNGGGK